MTTEKKKSGRGGKRPGAGRPTLPKSHNLGKVEAGPLQKKAQAMGALLPELSPDEDPLMFLINVMKSDTLEDRYRIDAAKAVLPYVRQKPTMPEKQGKKEQQEEEARQNHQGTGWGGLLDNNPAGLQ